MAEEQSPVLPATPWYESEVQLRAVIAIGFQILSIVMRYVPMPWLADNIDKITADASQLVALAFGAWAITKRQSSPIQPLALTTQSAAQKNADNPPMIATDPTKKGSI